MSPFLDFTSFTVPQALFFSSILFTSHSLPSTFYSSFDLTHSVSHRLRRINFPFQCRIPSLTLYCILSFLWLKCLYYFVICCNFVYLLNFLSLSSTFSPLCDFNSFQMVDTRLGLRFCIFSFQWLHSFSVSLLCHVLRFPHLLPPPSCDFGSLQRVASAQGGGW